MQRKNHWRWRSASDDKVKPRGSDQSEDEVKAAYKKQGDELESKRKAQGGELVDEDSDDDSEPKVDMSASIYEARLREFLKEDEEDDVGINPSKTLADNQIDTLLVKGLEKMKQGSSPLATDTQAKAAKAGIELDDDGNAIARQQPKGEIEKTADKISNAKSDDEYSASGRGDSSVLDEYADELEDILTTVANGKDISSNQKGYAQAILDEL